MLANGIKQTTATTGTGSLTLAAVSGAPKLSDAFPIGVRFAYTLLDVAGTFLEAGIGYLSDATTMVRARVSATFVSGTYNSGNPTAVSLSGTTTIIVTPHASTIESVIPTVDSVSAGINRFTSPANRTLYGGNIPAVALRCYYCPSLLKVGAPITALACNVATAAGAGATARLGIYAMKENGYIGDLLATTGDVDVSTTGLKNTALPAPIFLPPGWYYIAFVSSSNLTVAGWGSNLQYGSGGSPLGFAGTTPIEMRYETLASTVLPAAASGSTTAINMGVSNIPMILLGVAP